MPTELTPKETAPAEPPTQSPDSAEGQTEPSQERPLSPEAQRALAEAAARRAERDGHPADAPKEAPARGGPDPTRYGDWEVNGVASDF